MKNLTLILLAAASVLAGCSKSDNTTLPEQGGERQIRIASSVEASQTKAAVDDSKALSEVQVLRINVAADGAFPAGKFTGATVIKATRQNTGNKALDFGAAIPTYTYNDDKVYLAAYHPKTTVTSEVATWTINGKTDILLSDLFDAGKYSAPKTGAGSTNGDPMLFKHQLAQLEVICKAYTGEGVVESVVQDAWGKITSIELLNTPNAAKFTYANNAVTFEGAAEATGVALLNAATFEDAFVTGAIVINTTNVTTASGMFAPQTTAAKLKIKVCTEKVPTGVIIDVDLKDGSNIKPFERAKNHKITLSFKPDAKNIQVLSTQIEAWGTGYAGSGAIEKPIN